MRINGWTTKRLKDVAPLQRGFDLTKANLRDGTVPVISSSGLWGYHDEAKVTGPGIVIGRYGTLGDVFFVEEDFWPHNTTLWVTDFCGNYPEFINYLYRSLDISKHSGKTGVPGLNRNDLHTLKFAVPPVPEQQKISAILSTWDRAIELTEKLIAAKQKRKQALMQQLLTGKVRFAEFEASAEWSPKKIKQILKLTSGATKPADTTQSESGGCSIPVYGGNGVLGYSAAPNVDCETIIIGRVGEYCGTVRYLNEPIWITDNALYVKEWLEECSARWMAYLLEYRDLTRLRKKGGQPLVSQKPIYDLMVDVPCIDEQQQIAEVLSVADREVNLFRQRLAVLTKQKKGLMQQLLTGKVRVNVDAEMVKR